MTIDLDVHEMAKHYGLDERLIQAVVNAEGGGDAIIRAVQCSLPGVTTRTQAIDVLCRSAVHAMSDFLEVDGSRLAFVAWWAKRWAPVGAANDPQSKNQFWPLNVAKMWGLTVPT